MKRDIRLLSLMQENENFNKSELAAISVKCDTLGMALRKYKKVLFSKVDIPESFVITKEFIEQLFLEPLTNTSYDYIIAAMKFNNWTIQDLFNKCQSTGFNIMMLVGCPNTARQEVFV